LAKKSPLKSSLENENGKLLWNIPSYQDIPPKDGANKPYIDVQDKKGKQFIIFEGTVCNFGEIHDREQRKTEKYIDLRCSLKRKNPGK